MKQIPLSGVCYTFLPQELPQEDPIYRDFKWRLMEILEEKHFGFYGAIQDTVYKQYGDVSDYIGAALDEEILT